MATFRPLSLAEAGPLVGRPAGYCVNGHLLIPQNTVWHRIAPGPRHAGGLYAVCRACVLASKRRSAARWGAA